MVLKFGIMGCGLIAIKMAETISKMSDRVCKFACASRSAEKAKEFAQKYGFEKSYGSYEELCKDPDVELIYCATPHSEHYNNAKMIIKYKKNCLMEKAFTVSARQAKEVLELAKKEKVLFAEAIWPRYMPSRKMIDDLIKSGKIGKPKLLTANLGYPIAHIERIYKPELAGGALLDVGVYAINFCLMCFGNDYKELQSTCLKFDTGVDSTTSMLFNYGDKIANLHCNTSCKTDNFGIIYGTEGSIVVQNINNPEWIELHDKNFNLISKTNVPEQITGYEYEVDCCINALKKGLLECPEMPHSETIFLMETMDKVRSQIGVKYSHE